MKTLHVLLTLPLAALCCQASPPYVERQPLLAAGQHLQVQAMALDDLNAMGQFGAAGEIGPLTSSATYTYDTTYMHNMEMASGIVPLAYRDLALSAFAMGRYTDAIHGALKSIEQAKLYYQGDAWLVSRALNLEDNSRVLYQSYLKLGNLAEAARYHRQFLIVSELVNSDAFKFLDLELICLRMTSLKELSNYLDKHHWSNCTQFWVTAATTAAAIALSSQGHHEAAAAVIATGASVVLAVEYYKIQLKAQHSFNVAQLMTEFATMANLPPPSPQDIERLKRSTNFYHLAMARDSTNAVDKAQLQSLAATVTQCVDGLDEVKDADGNYHITGDLPALLAYSMRLDEVPLSLPPPAKRQDVFLDKYLSPSLFRMSGLRMTPEEAALLKDAIGDGKSKELVLDLRTEKGRELMRAIDRIKRKAKEGQAWASSL